MTLRDFNPYPPEEPSRKSVSKLRKYTPSKQSLLESELLKSRKPICERSLMANAEIILFFQIAFKYVEV